MEFCRVQPNYGQKTCEECGGRYKLDIYKDNRHYCSSACYLERYPDKETRNKVREEAKLLHQPFCTDVIEDEVKKSKKDYSHSYHKTGKDWRDLEEKKIRDQINSLIDEIIELKKKYQED